MPVGGGTPGYIRRSLPRNPVSCRFTGLRRCNRYSNLGTFVLCLLVSQVFSAVFASSPCNRQEALRYVFDAVFSRIADKSNIWKDGNEGKHHQYSDYLIFYSVTSNGVPAHPKEMFVVLWSRKKFEVRKNSRFLA